MIEPLPPVVARYLAKVRAIPILSVKLRHGGTFRPKLDGGWLAIRGEQQFTADPPGFIWRGRVTVAPGIWVEAVDRCVNGSGRMTIKLESLYRLADRTGPEIDQGAMVRLLGEMLWFPTAFADQHYVTWSAVDDRSAKAKLRIHDREVCGIFVFGEDGLPVGFRAQRYRDLGDGTAVITPFSATCADFQPVDGIPVPYEMNAAWVVDGREMPYARFRVERIEFAPPASR